jgi:hypothetical protein
MVCNLLIGWMIWHLVMWKKAVYINIYHYLLTSIFKEETLIFFYERNWPSYVLCAYVMFMLRRARATHTKGNN